MRRVDRHITPAIVVAATVALGAVGWFVPQAVPPVASGPGEVTSRTTVLCASEAKDERKLELVAAGTADGDLRLTELGESEDLEARSEPGAVALRVGTGSYAVVATGSMTASSASAMLTRAGDGPDRGLAAQACRPAGVNHWFTGVAAGEDQFSTVLVTNPDAQPAEVSLRIHGPDGIVSATGSSGLEIPPYSTRAIPLEGMVPESDGSLAVQVRATSGRVSAVMRDRHQKGAEQLGADWISPTEDPAVEQVIAGVPGGDGDRTLVVVNPGERSTTVTVEALGAEGAFTLDGADQVDVPAGATVEIPLQESLGGDEVGLRVTSDQPVAAAVNAITVDGDRHSDVATLVSATPVSGAAVLPIASGADVSGRVVVSNAGAEPATAEVVLRDRSGKEVTRSTVELAAGASAGVAVKKDGLWAEVITDAERIHAAVVLTSTRDDIAGLAWLPAVSPPAAEELPAVVADPRVAR